jgi:hypothetical protein
MEACHVGPFLEHELLLHLVTRHNDSHEYLRQPNLYEFMKQLRFVGQKTPSGDEWIPIRLARLQLQNNDFCPLTAGGCTFRVSYADMDMKSHILGHNLEDRYDNRASISIHCQEFKLDLFQNEVLDRGPFVCPFDQEWWLDPQHLITRCNGRFLDLAKHLVESHSIHWQMRDRHGGPYKALEIAFFVTYSYELKEKSYIHVLVCQLLECHCSSWEHNNPAAKIDALEALTKLLSEEPIGTLTTL